MVEKDSEDGRRKHEGRWRKGLKKMDDGRKMLSAKQSGGMPFMTSQGTVCDSGHLI